MLVTVDGFGVVRGTICMPLVGAWHADLLVDAESGFQGALTVQIADQLELVATTDRSLAYQGMTQLRMVAGANGLRRTATPTYYRRPTVRQVLTDLLEKSGDTLAESADAAILSQQLHAWTTILAPVGQMVAALVEAAPGANWRLLSDGGVWVGRETWPDSGVDVVELSEDGCNAVVELGVDAPVLLPGTTVNERRISYVEHRIESDSVRSLVWFAEDDG